MRMLSACPAMSRFVFNVKRPTKIDVWVKEKERITLRCFCSWSATRATYILNCVDFSRINLYMVLFLQSKPDAFEGMCVDTLQSRYAGDVIISHCLSLRPFESKQRIESIKRHGQHTHSYKHYKVHGK